MSVTNLVWPIGINKIFKQIDPFKSPTPIYILWTFPLKTDLNLFLGSKIKTIWINVHFKWMDPIIRTTFCTHKTIKLTSLAAMSSHKSREIANNDPAQKLKIKLYYFHYFLPRPIRCEVMAGRIFSVSDYACIVSTLKWT